MSHEHGERIPLTIADFDRDAARSRWSIQAVGKTTREMQQTCQVGTHLLRAGRADGHPEPYRPARRRSCASAAASASRRCIPQARAFKQSGAYVIGVVGFRNKDLIFWEDKFRVGCDELIVCTDDGSAGMKGLVTAGIAQALAATPATSTRSSRSGRRS